MKASRILIGLLSMTLLNIAFGNDDRVTTEGGEVILGSYLKTVDGVIHFHSDAFGLIHVESSKAKLTRGIVGPVVIHAKTEPVAQVGSTPPVTPAPAEGQWRRLFGLPESFQAQLSIGLSILEGASGHKALTTALTFGNVSAKQAMTGNLSYAKGEARGILYREDLSAKVDYLRFLKKGRDWYAYVGTHYENDLVHLVDYDFDLLVGLGRTIIQTKKMTLRFTGAVNAEWEDLDSSHPGTIPDPSRTYETKFGFSNEFDLLLTPTISFKESFSYLVNPDDGDDYDLSLKLQLSAALTKLLSMQLIYTYDYNGTSAFRIPKGQPSITSQLGYKF